MRISKFIICAFTCLTVFTIGFFTVHAYAEEMPEQEGYVAEAVPETEEPLEEVSSIAVEPATLAQPAAEEISPEWEEAPVQVDVFAEQDVVDVEQESIAPSVSEQANEWVWIGEDLYFYGEDGTPVTGLFEVGGEFFYADENGVVQKGLFWDWGAGSVRYADPVTYRLQQWWQSVENNMYFFDEYYLAKQGLFSVGDDSYFADVTGVVQTGLFWDWPAGGLRYGDPVTLRLQKGWVTVAPDTMFFFSDEYLAVENGWATYNGGYYYFAGFQPLRGWNEVDGKVYFFEHATGVMATNWAQDGDLWFRFDPSGQYVGLTASFDVSVFANEVINLINELRAEAGVGALQVDEVVWVIADLRAAETGVLFSHTRPDGREFHTIFQDADYYTWTYYGENIARGFKSPESVVNAWFNSLSHRENMLRAEYTYIGVGIYEDENGNLYWCPLFVG